MQDILTYGCVNTVNPAYARVKEREPHTSYTTDLDMCLEVSKYKYTLGILLLRWTCRKHLEAKQDTPSFP